MMTGIDGGPLLWAAYFTVAALSLSLVAAFARLLLGPTLPDRVIALDFVAYLTMGFLGAYAVISERESYIDAALVLGLLAFLGTLGLARYIERRGSDARGIQDL